MWATRTLEGLVTYRIVRLSGIVSIPWNSRRGFLGLDKRCTRGRYAFPPPPAYVVAFRILNKGVYRVACSFPSPSFGKGPPMSQVCELCVGGGGSPAMR